MLDKISAFANSLSFILALWVSCIGMAAVWGWGEQLHASLSFQTFCALSLPVVLSHVGIITGKRVNAANAAKQAANQAATAPEAAAPPAAS